MSKSNPDYYQLCIKGKLDKRWSNVFEDFIISFDNENFTYLTGPVRDQAELYGLLNLINKMGMNLLSVNITTPPIDESEEDV